MPTNKIVYYDPGICQSLANSNISNTMISDIEKSEKLKKEIGYNIDNNFRISNKCTGHKCSVKIKSPKEPFGSFHTHPSGSLLFSDPDLKHALDKGYDFSCIGTKERKYYILCVEIDKNKEYQEIKHKVNEFEKSRKEYTKSSSKQKMEMIQNKQLRTYPSDDVLRFMKKQKECMITHSY